MRRTMLFMLIITLLNATTAGAQGNQANESEAQAARRSCSARRVKRSEAKPGWKRLRAFRQRVNIAASANFKVSRVSAKVSWALISCSRTNSSKPKRDRCHPATKSPNSRPEWRSLLSGLHFEQSGSGEQGIPVGGNTPDPKDELRAEGARYLLAWLLTSSSSLPIELTYVGEAKTKEGVSDVLAAKGPHGFAARLCWISRHIGPSCSVIAEGRSGR